MKNFCEGVSVRCIDGQFHDLPTNPTKMSEINLPIQGGNYTFRSVVDTPYGLGIRLVEIQNDKCYFSDIDAYREPIFAVNKFEIVRRKKE